MLGWFGAGPIPMMAKGGIAKGGLTLVGEEGPELVNLPKGAMVHSNAESRRMGGNTINVNVSGSWSIGFRVKRYSKENRTNGEYGNK